MNLLLDTHTFIFFINGDKQLPKKNISLIEDANNSCYLSIASIWEITIKLSLDKLELTGDFERIPEFLSENKIFLKPIVFEDFKILKKLPLHHRDPFDRLIIAQAQAEKFKIITKDRQFNAYDVEVIW